MGIFSSSCFQTTSSSPIRTAKLILEDGRLEEFASPFKVSTVLEENKNVFICNSDEMFLDSTLCAVNAEDELQLGELYFALPLSWLDSPLTAEDMGSLTIRASLALKGRIRGDQRKFSGCGLMRKMDSLVFNSRRVGVPVMGFGNDDTVDGGGVVPLVKEKRRGGGGRGRSFRSKLNVILEE